MEIRRANLLRVTGIIYFSISLSLSINNPSEIMKPKAASFLIFLMIPGLFLFYSCADKPATLGNLTITAIAPDTVALSSLTVVMATSQDKFNSGSYGYYGTLNSSGSHQFRDLAPGYYWYRIEGWDDYGAAEVYAGVDGSVIIHLDSPSQTKK